MSAWHIDRISLLEQQCLPAIYIYILIQWYRSYIIKNKERNHSFYFCSKTSYGFCGNGDFNFTACSSVETLPNIFPSDFNLILPLYVKQSQSVRRNRTNHNEFHVISTRMILIASSNENSLLQSRVFFVEHKQASKRRNGPQFVDYLAESKQPTLSDALYLSVFTV